MKILLVLGAIILVGFMVFGKNPLREFQNNQKVMMEKYGSDEITAQTNMYLEKQQQQGQSGQILNPGEIINVMPQTDRKAPQSASQLSDSIKKSATIVGNDPRFREKGVYVAPPSPDMRGDGFNDVIIKQNTLPGENKVSGEGLSDYYPPIINTQQPEKKLTGNEVRLRSGQLVVLDGVMVYSVASDGERTLLPDGEYTLQDGTRFTVGNGRKLY